MNLDLIRLQDRGIQQHPFVFGEHNAFEANAANPPEPAGLNIDGAAG